MAERAERGRLGVAPAVAAPPGKAAADRWVVLSDTAAQQLAAYSGLAALWELAVVPPKVAVPAPAVRPALAALSQLAVRPPRVALSALAADREQAGP